MYSERWLDEADGCKRMNEKNLYQAEETTIRRQPNAAEQDDFSVLMSLSLDELLDEEERNRFERYLADYATLAAEWQAWQSMHRQLVTIPHAIPAPGFVERFELQLLQQERRRRLRQGIWIGALSLLLWVGVVVSVVGVGSYLFVNQSVWLSETIQNVIFWWATAAHWLQSLIAALAIFAGTPQGKSIGVAYVMLAFGMLGAWSYFLRRATQLVESPAQLSTAEYA